MEQLTVSSPATLALQRALNGRAVAAVAGRMMLLCVGLLVRMLVVCLLR
jgi:hypothetical protein